MDDGYLLRDDITPICFTVDKELGWYFLWKKINGAYNAIERGKIIKEGQDYGTRDNFGPREIKLVETVASSYILQYYTHSSSAGFY